MVVAGRGGSCNQGLKGCAFAKGADRSSVVVVVVAVGPATAGTVGAALDFEDDGAVDEAVEQGHGQGRVAKVVGPGR